MRVRITELVKDKLEHLGQIELPDFLLPSTGDKLYYKTIRQYKIIDRQFNLMEQSLYDVELFIQKT